MATIINLTIEGKEYEIDITNNLRLLGELIINEIKKQIRTMKLISESKGAGSYLQRWYASVDEEGLRIESGVDYSIYLEFGTFMFGQLFDETSFPETATISKMFKKKDLPREIRDILPMGMIPFAPVRRVLYNNVLMNRLVRQAFAPI